MDSIILNDFGSDLQIVTSEAPPGRIRGYFSKATVQQIVQPDLMVRLETVSERAGDLSEIYTGPSPYSKAHPLPPAAGLWSPTCSRGFLFPCFHNPMALTLYFLKGLHDPSPPDTWLSCRMNSPDILFTLVFFHCPSMFFMLLRSF